MSTIYDRGQKLYNIASTQQGYFSAKQALSCGYSHRLQHYHKEKAHWIEIERGFFRFANFPSSPNEDFVRWSFWSRNREDIPQAVVSHESALAIHELSDVMPSKIHLTVPPSFRKKCAGGCILHRSILPPEVVEKREGFFVTTPLQTIIDVADSTLSLEQLEQAVRDALTKGFMMPANIAKAKMSATARERVEIVLGNIKRKPIL